MLLLQTGFNPEGVVGIIGNLGPLAQTVLAILAIFSVFSWAVIVDRLWLLRKARRQTGKFLSVFQNSSRFAQVKKAAGELETAPVSGIFLAGYREISSQVRPGSRAQEQEEENRSMLDLQTLERTLRKAAHEERRALQRGMLFLATTGSVTPFIGLFGTVWGIMNAFHSIGQFGNANLAVVAPGISEALVTTAGGLAAAIPAVIAYNHLLSQIRELAGDMEDFGLEFLNVVQKTWKVRAR